MSLDFSYANVKDQSVMWDANDRMIPEVESIIFHTMFLGQNTITEDNYRTFYTRYTMYNISRGYGENYFKLENVRAMVGLSTNASNKTEAAFKKECVENLIKTAQALTDSELNALGIL